jgi:hypothetical protein
MQAIAVFLSMALWVAASSVTAQESSVFVEGLHCAGGRFGLVMPSDLRTLKNLGKITREEVSEVEQWDNYKATRKVIHFEGMTVGLIEFSNDPTRYMLTSADLTGPTWNRISPFKLRQLVSQAALVLGEHAKFDPGLRHTYGSENDSVKIQSTNGIVTRVSYACYSG